MLFLAGVLLEWAEISFVVLPLFLPYFAAQGVDMVWLAALICIHMQTSFLTPPTGWSLFFLRGVSPPVVQTREIDHGVWLLIHIQLGVVLIVMFFPAHAHPAFDEPELTGKHPAYAGPWAGGPL